MHVGDKIESINGTQVTTVAEFLKAVHLPAGSRVSLGLVRGSSAQTVSVVLAPAPTEHDPAVDTRYLSVDVDGSLRRVLLTVPHGKTGPFPTLMIVGGIGCYSIDNINPQDAYRNLAHDLGRRGIAVLRLEKSGLGDSQGPPCSTVDFTSEMRSYEVTLAWLTHNPDVDASHIFLLGHSIGGVVVPRLAASQRVAGVIAADTVGINWYEYELINMRRQIALSGADPSTVDSLMKTFQRCVALLEINGAEYKDILRDHPDCATPLSIYPVPAAYMKEVADLNIGEPWTKLNVPVLAVYGRSDFITDESDHQRIVDMVNAGHPGSAQLEVIGNMDHYLTVVDSQKKSQDLASRQVFGPYNHAFSQDIGNWICLRARCTDPPAATGANVFPLRYVDNRMMMQWMIDGKGPYWMIVDTGVIRTILTPATAKSLGLTLRKAASVTGVGNHAADLSVTKIAGLQAGSITASNLDAEVIDLTEIQRGIGFPHLDGVVGYEALKNYSVRVDVDDSTLTISRDTLPAPAGAYRVSASGPLLSVPVKIDGLSGSAVVDTGDRSSLTLFNKFAAAHGLYDRFPGIHNVLTGFGVGGPVHGDVFRNPTLEIFGGSLNNVVARASRQTGGVFATANQAGSVGGGILRRFNVIYDYPAQRIFAWPSKVFSQADPYDTIGWWLSQSSRGIFVASITKGGPADRGGVRVGDIVVTVNQAAVPEAAATLRDALVRIPAGRMVQLTLNRDGQLLHTNVRTADQFGRAA